LRDYYYALGIFNTTSRAEYYRVIKSIAYEVNPVRSFINYTLQLIRINLLSESLVEELYPVKQAGKISIEVLNRTFTNILNYFYNRSHTIPPSILTTMRLAADYLYENEELESIIGLYLNELVTIMAELALVHASEYYKTPMISRIETTTIVKIVMPDTLYYIILLVMCIGSFILGYSIRKTQA
ncbi:MAG: hypothetical protein ABWW65_03380, partial [Thermoprotei archaeon]